LKIERADLCRVLETAGEKSGWSKPLPKENGKRFGRGIACNVYHGESLTAQVAEVSVSENGKFKVERVVCVIDCGQVVNPLGLEGQIESGIAWGLSPALHKPVSFKNGQAEQSSFLDFNVLRMSEMPRVEVYTIDKQTRPFGVGEPSVPPVAPAVANALFAATGKRLRRLPFDLT
jgi:isoquinoline 1-oxidoreductase subunit beta